MKIKIGCVDGKVYQSDRTDPQQIEKDIAKFNGAPIGTNLDGDSIYTAEEAYDVMEDVLRNAFALKKANITLTINRVDRTFNARHIVWWEIDRA